MSDYNDNEVTDKHIDFQLHLDLPADAPAGKPHLVDLSPVNEELPWYDLNAVDTVVTVLYRWSPKALHNLLDLTKREFHWGHLNGSGYEFYVSRKFDRVCMGLMEIGRIRPDYEIVYFIRGDGSWKITSCRDTTFGYRTSTARPDKLYDHCPSYDQTFALQLISWKMWQKNNDEQSFRYEVNGKDMLDEPDSDDDE